jgi:hypothetical protein
MNKLKGKKLYRNNLKGKKRNNVKGKKRYSNLKGKKLNRNNSIWNSST